MKSVLFYDDGAEFGGHEVMTVEAVKYLVRNTDLNIRFMFYEGNTILHEQISLIRNSFGNLKLYPIKYKSGRLQNIKTLFSFLKLKRIKSLIKNINPDIVVVAQGRIEASTMGLVAAKRCGYKTISYIPIAHKVSVAGNKIGSAFRDTINSYFYSLPDRFITVSHSMKDLLIARGVTSKISVVYNGIDIKKYKAQGRRGSRQRYSIDDEDYAVALIGRIQFKQKAHDFLIDTISKHRSRLRNIKLLIVGNGPDKDVLRSIIESKNLNSLVSLIPWSDDLSYIYSAIDMLVIPSHFEGVPLVMLEAMYYGLPIVASNVDGMAEILPKEWLFQPGDSNSMIETLIRVKNGNNTDIIQRNKSRIVTEFNIDNFGHKFYEVFSGKN